MRMQTVKQMANQSGQMLHILYNKKTEKYENFEIHPERSIAKHKITKGKLRKALDPIFGSRWTLKTLSNCQNMSTTKFANRSGQTVHILGRENRGIRGIFTPSGAEREQLQGPNQGRRAGRPHRSIAKRGMTPCRSVANPELRYAGLKTWYMEACLVTHCEMGKGAGDSRIRCMCDRVSCLLSP